MPQSEGATLAALEAGALLSEKKFEGNLMVLRRVDRRRCWSAIGAFANGVEAVAGCELQAAGGEMRTNRSEV